MNLIGIVSIKIDAGSEIGKMFYITVSAENKDGLSQPSRPFYIRSRNDNQTTYSKYEEHRAVIFLVRSNIWGYYKFLFLPVFSLWEAAHHYTWIDDDADIARLP